MPPGLLLYGANGYVGEAIARLAVEQALAPIIAGRDAAAIGGLAAELGVEPRVFDLGEPEALRHQLEGVTVVLNCAGPFIHTFEALAAACLRAGTHYLDLTGEIPVFQAAAALDADARTKNVMLLPGAGYDVVPSDCLALHLKRRLPSATHLTLGLRGVGSSGSPPGTQRTAIEMARYGSLVRRDGRLEAPREGIKTRMIDFGDGPVEAALFPWSDVFTAFYSTGIPNIEVYSAMSRALRQGMAVAFALKPLFRLGLVRRLMNLGVRPGPTAEERARVSTHIWGEVSDPQGRAAIARMHGPEAGVNWTARAALSVLRRVLAGEAPPGFQTPARAYGPELALEVEGVTREDVM